MRGGGLEARVAHRTRTGGRAGVLRAVPAYFVTSQ